MTLNFSPTPPQETMTQSMFENLRPITSRGLSDTLLDRMVDMILDGTLQPGFVFPNENLMCEKLHIGRSTLRETYKALGALGFITRSKKGTVVNGTKHIISSVPLNFILKNSDFKDIDDFRQMLETETATLAAQRASDEQVAQMEQILAHMAECGDDIGALVEADIAFHLAIAGATGNDLLLRTLTAVLTEIEKSAYAGFVADPTLIERSRHFHEQILEAIRSRDKSQARAAMRAHVKDIYIVLRQLPQGAAPQREEVFHF